MRKFITTVVCIFSSTADVASAIPSSPIPDLGLLSLSDWDESIVALVEGSKKENSQLSSSTTSPTDTALNKAKTAAPGASNLSVKKWAPKVSVGEDFIYELQAKTIDDSNNDIDALSRIKEENRTTPSYPVDLKELDITLTDIPYNKLSDETGEIAKHTIKYDDANALLNDNTAVFRSPKKRLHTTQGTNGIENSSKHNWEGVDITPEYLIKEVVNDEGYSSNDNGNEQQQQQIKYVDDTQLTILAEVVPYSNKKAAAETKTEPSNTVTIVPTNGNATYLVKIPGFKIDKQPVSNAQYKRFVQSTLRKAPTHWPSGNIPIGLELQPVTNISYKDALAYASWAGKRLPSQVELQRAQALYPHLFANESRQSSNSSEWTATSFAPSVDNDPNKAWLYRHPYQYDDPHYKVVRNASTAQITPMHEDAYNAHTTFRLANPIDESSS